MVNTMNIINIVIILIYDFIIPIKNKPSIPGSFSIGDLRNPEVPTLLRAQRLAHLGAPRHLPEHRLEGADRDRVTVTWGLGR